MEKSQIVRHGIICVLCILLIYYILSCRLSHKSKIKAFRSILTLSICSLVLQFNTPYYKTISSKFTGGREKLKNEKKLIDKTNKMKKYNISFAKSTKSAESLASSSSSESSDDIILSANDIKLLAGNPNLDTTISEILNNKKIHIQHTNREHGIISLNNSDLEKFRIANLNGKKSEYVSRKYEFKYITHWGQLKLLLSEIEFLTIAMKTLDIRKKFIFIYAGAATGDHIPYLRDLFPSIEFLLYDPAEFNIVESERIKIVNDYFFDSTAQELAIKYEDYNILFCSDIRTEDSSDPESFIKTTDEDIVENMKMQFNWYRMLNPDLSMFKFRLPFNNENYIYPEGLIYYQAFCGPTSTETRLIVKKNAKDIIYNNKDYEQVIFYHNTNTRKNNYDLIGKLDLKKNDVCNCYDCTALIFIINSYIELTEKTSNNIKENREIILKKIREVINNTNKKHKRTLYEQTKQQFIKKWEHIISHYLNKKKYIKNSQGYRANTKSFKIRNNDELENLRI